MAGRLEGEVALVTGSTSGLGREIARVMAAEGASVVVTGRDAQRGAATVAACEGAAAFIAADLADAASRDALVAQTVERFGGLTVLVNNAVSTARDGPVVDLDPDAFARTLAVNLVAPAALCRAAIPRMLDAGHGSIVNVSSRAAARGTPGLTAYSASKAGLESLARSITMDYAGAGSAATTSSPPTSSTRCATPASRPSGGPSSRPATSRGSSPRRTSPGRWCTSPPGSRRS